MSNLQKLCLPCAEISFVRHGYATYDKGVQKQKGADPLFSSKERKQAIVQLLRSNSLLLLNSIHGL